MKKLFLSTAKLGVTLCMTAAMLSLIAYPAGFGIGAVAFLFTQGWGYWPH